MHRCLSPLLCIALPPQNNDTVHTPLWTHELHLLQHIGTLPNADETSTQTSSGTCSTAPRIYTFFKKTFFQSFSENRTAFQPRHQRLQQHFNSIAIRLSTLTFLSFLHLHPNYLDAQALITKHERFLTINRKFLNYIQTGL